MAQENAVSVSFILNGKAHGAVVTKDLSLLDYLRDTLHLAGTKNGCNQGYCGTCTVLINGRAVKSCLARVSRLDGKSVLTIEGLTADDGGLHPIQEAFLAAGAIQCGFCTPGMVLRAKALLDKSPDPADEDIVKALSANICRCTGYVKIKKAVRLAARLLAEGPKGQPIVPERGGVGKRVPDIDGREKATGALKFANDYFPQAVLHGAVCWSRHPHAEIEDISIEAAGKLKGVHVILTHKDVPGRNLFGVATPHPDHPVLAGDRVRFVGDAVAVVLAESIEIARRARDLIQVRYRILDGVFDPRRGLEADAPKVHAKGNICQHIFHQTGEIDKGFAQAHLVVSGHFETPAVEHAYLEPDTALAYPEQDGGITVLAPTQSPFDLQRSMAKVLGLAEEKVHIRCTPLGGAFGSRTYMTVECLAALGALKTGRPVKISLTSEESIRVSTKRHAFYMDYRVGVDKTGKLLAVDAKLISDAGPYRALSHMVIDQACMFSCGPYLVPNLRIEGWAVHTNNANGGAFRGFGINQAAVAMESLLDEIAVKLHMSPFDLRIKNALVIGDPTAAGEILKVSVAIRQTLEAAQKAFLRLPAYTPSAQNKRIGIGVASAFKNVGSGKGSGVDHAGARLKLKKDGRFQLNASAVDMGQGIRSALCQIACEVLGTTEDRIHIITGDTRTTPPHGPAVGQRQVFINGNAVYLAACKLRDMLLERAVAYLPGGVSQVKLSADGVVENTTGRLLMDLKELARMAHEKKETLEVAEFYVAPRTFPLADQAGRKEVPLEEYRNYPAYAYATQVVVIELNLDTGEVEIKKVIAAHDVGRAINPQIIEGQLEGSCLMGQGYALTEQYVLKEGIPVTTTLKKLGLPTIKDAPEIELHLVEDPDPHGPFGAKGVSEIATVPITPAILNAIYDAAAVRVRRLPASPKTILSLLAAKKD
ncbi:MAG: molybdopterin-dependent oxidoreductase [Desulfobacterales bacterium]|nr:molybdopterin-dependent oxidoreductase [Desulfobacterales bacterium]